VNRPGGSAPAALAFGAGVVLWLVAAAATGRREAWDAGIYWSLFYPLSLAVAGILAYLFPKRPWRWAAALFLGQLVAMAVRSGEIGNLFPLGLIAFGVLSLPAVAVARFGSRLKLGRSHS
jgi:hypothetical protein